MLTLTRPHHLLNFVLAAALCFAAACSGDLEDASLAEGINAGGGGSGSGGAVLDPNAVCGDGSCSVGESVFSCAQDCEPSEYATCLLTACFSELSSCQLVSGCYDAMNCIEACGPGEACQSTCGLGLSDEASSAYSAALSCGQAAGCEPAEVEAPEPTPPANSCTGRCGFGPDDTVDCSCEQTCVFAGDCCEDYEAICISGAADAVCGDGTCDASESQATCPDDCRQAPGGTEAETSDILGCLFESCNTEATACVADATCALVLDCLGACPEADKDCYVGCAADGGFSPTVLDFGVCLNESGCLDSTGGGIAGVCGDGKCRGDETPQSCPEDCRDEPTASCGDDICSDGEIGTCAADCPEVGDCVNEQCYPQLENCYYTEGCMDGLECAANCNSASCEQDCYEGLSQAARGALTSILQCANDECTAPAQGGGGGSECGNGVCEGGENQDNCPADCGGGGTGQPGPGGGCGDGYCDASETQDSCPEDCTFQDPGAQCAYEECGPEIDGCVGDPTCAQLLNCLNQCGQSRQCAQGCYQNGNEQAFALLEQLGTCLEDECSNPGQGGGGGGPDLVNEEAECIVEACGVGNQCQNNPDCIGAINCMAECDDSECIDDCVDIGGGAENYLRNQIQPCALEACLDINDGPGGGGEAGCGDGICDESTFEEFWCPQDCEDDEPGGGGPGGGGGGPGGNPGDIDPEEVLECLEDSCSSQLEACYSAPSCASVIDCILDCPAGDQNCLFGCVGFTFDQTIIGLATCGGQAGCVDIGF